MAQYNYSKQVEGESYAKAVAREVGVSEKQSVNIAKFLRHKKLAVAKKLLEEVISMKRAVPYKRYNQEMAHRRGKMASGGFPVKASSEFLKLLKAVEANAQFKGLNINLLVITHIKASLGARPYHYGRQKRRKFKRTNIEVIVEERKLEEKKKDKRQSHQEQKPEHKLEHKPEHKPQKEAKHEEKK